jgi:antitoxin HicB
MHYAYPATLEFEASGAVSVHFDGLPGATWGETREQALDRAKDLLATAIEMVRDDGDVLPPPPPANGRPIVEADLD